MEGMNIKSSVPSFPCFFPYGTILFVYVDLADEYNHSAEHESMDG